MDEQISIILEEIVRKSGMEQDKFAESIGLKKAAFNNYIKGRRELPKKVISSLMEVHNVNPQIFFDRTVPLYIRDLVLDKPNIVNNSAENVVRLPLFGSVAAGALATVDGITKDNVEFLPIPQQFLGKYANCSNLFGMIVNGESMNKVIKHNNVVIAKPLELEQYKNGDIVIFSYNNEYSLKRFAPDELEGFVLFKSESDDPAFRDIPISKNDLDSLKLYGKVVFYGTSL